MKARILTLAAAAMLAACGSGSDAGQDAGASVEPGATGTLPSRAEQVEGASTPVDTLTADPSTTPGAGSPLGGTGASTTSGAGSSGTPAGSPAPATAPAAAGQPTPPARATQAPNAPAPANAAGDTAHAGHTP
jgi:hypothetical protein